MDSDLADAVESLKAIFAKRKLPCSFAKASVATIDELRKQLRVPARYRNFLLAANPEKVETVTPVVLPGATTSVTTMLITLDGGLALPAASNATTL